MEWLITGTKQPKHAEADCRECETHVNVGFLGTSFRFNWAIFGPSQNEGQIEPTLPLGVCFVRFPPKVYFAISCRFVFRVRETP